MPRTKKKLLAAALFMAMLGGFVPRLRAEPVRLAMEVFGSEAEIEVRDFSRSRAEPVMRRALLEIFEVSQLVDPASTIPGGVGAIARSAQQGEKDGAVVDPRTFALLRRSLQFCIWSGGAIGPLGGGIYQLWQDGVPPSLELREAVSQADCRRLQLSTSDAAPRAAVPAGSSIDLRGMVVGFALDRAAAVLLEAGIDNALVEIGDVVRAIGPGPDGQGWLVSVPGVPGTRDPLDQIYLRDQSLAVLRVADRGDRGPRLVDLRTGVLAQGVVAVVAVSELAIDTEALAATLYVVGYAQGQLLLGQLDPRPSVLWLLGQNKGTPLESRYRWSSLARTSR